MAVSTLLTGFAVDTLQAQYGLPPLDVYRLLFLAYALVGFVKLICSLCISAQVELEPRIRPSPIVEASVADDRRPLLSEEEAQRPVTYDAISERSLVVTEDAAAPMFTPESRSFIWKMSLAITPDYVGSGLAQIAWMIYFFKREYEVDESSLGLAIFIASIVASFLNLLSSPMSRALGQVPTMVICHTITSVSLLLITAPSNKALALGLFMLRIVLREIDAAPRQAFIAGGVLDEERTSAVGCLNVVKTVGSCVGLFLTGEFAGRGLFWVAFVVAGGLKLLHNVFIVSFFWSHKGRYET